MATVRLVGSTSVAVNTVGSSDRRFVGGHGAQGLVKPVAPFVYLAFGVLHLVAIGVVAVALRCQFGYNNKEDDYVACTLVCWCVTLYAVSFALLSFECFYVSSAVAVQALSV